MSNNNELKINLKNLGKLLKIIKTDHNDKNVRKKSAKVILGPSVLRPFKKEVKNNVRKTLSNITIEKLKQCKGQKHFEKMFRKNVKRIGKILRKGIRIRKDANKKSCFGAHAPKILSLYLRNLLTNSWDSISHKDFNRIEKLLYVPIDRIIIDKLVELEFTLFEKKENRKRIRTMKDISDLETFFKTQYALDEYIKDLHMDMPRVWFDDVWITNS